MKDKYSYSFIKKIYNFEKSLYLLIFIDVSKLNTKHIGVYIN